MNARVDFDVSQPAIVFQDRPELQYRGTRFVAFYAGRATGVRGYGNCQSEAEDDLHRNVEDHLEWLAGRARANGDGAGQCIGGPL